MRLATATRRTLAMLLIAAAMLVQGVLPQGRMVEQRPGGITITLCNSDAQITIPMKRDHRPTDDGADHTKACAYAVAGIAIEPPGGLALPPLPQIAAAAWNATREQAQRPARLNPLPPATGPPILG